MPIQWFPGHMASARKKAAEAMAAIDVVIEVTDARLPEASSNPMIAELRRFRNRPCLKLLNKSDLADPAATQAWMDFYNRQPGVRAVSISARNPSEAARVPALCRQLAPHRDDGTKPLRMMIMGIPNVGKSTLMNALLKRKVAKVGDEPAVTKHQQTLDLGPGMTLTDTPGMMWPKIDYDLDGYMLAASHAIGRNAVIDEEVAAFLGGILLERYPSLLAARYRIDPATLDAPALVEAIGRRRGCLVKGGGLDLEKASLILLQDYRDGALGRVSLETPESRARMIAQVEAARAEAGASAGSEEA
ncbi:ribosome biogenesis GTPase YlqF [Thauera linaloolentis]|uniref:Ribosome biogenesis GTPase A n=1 Tax=Thauera linaloolentis (strain DSM 12138 / JCM 21573 / CCUG 41526 / CIP 105981 / IAM 15112 / NBRC 102519 / 47Lol) TaxID=1123367 RepID=N6Z7H0_THAL4|nr:ribosome biogenesis GTPase YlqF [Thauera linaloolentis]ENO90517.1 GTP-binding HSR1-like protein [Thauera linaloolentis 47Lol = DSM 12138]MCM8566376.1 ribosome biogenesis GTPase YlqF [Thauera linaloolentis]